MRKKVLVTGGAGFIGSHLVERLNRSKFRVAVVDNLVHGDRARLPAEVKFFPKDVRDQDLVEVFRRFRPATVYHLAAQQEVGRASKDPVFDASVNILGTINLLECCRQTKVEKIIYAGSVAGFGEPRKLPLSVSHPRQPISFYGISKHTVEHYLRVYQQRYGLAFVGLVLANVYGPRQDHGGEGGVVAIFAHRMANNLAIEIFGQGQQTRDFIYVDDVVAAFIQAMKKGNNQFLMVGTGKETSVNQLFEVMKELTGYRSRPVYRPPRPDDVQRSVFSVGRTARVLQWKPRHDLRGGLRKTIKSFNPPTPR